MPEVILPGTYITVRDEGLITAGRIASGYIGIVGTASRGPVDQVVTLGSFTEARNVFGDADPWRGGADGELTLIRALEQVFNNGGSTVYAVRAAGADAKGNSLSKRATYAVKAGGASPLTLSAATPGTWANDISVVVTKGATDKDPSTLELVLGTAHEVFTGATAGDLGAAVNKSSRLATAAVNAAAAGAVPDAVDEDAKAVFKGGASGEAAGGADYARGLALLENEIVNIVILAGQDTGMADVLEAHLKRTEQIRRERIGVIGSNGKDDVDAIAGHAMDNGRLIFVAPGIRVKTPDPATRKDVEISLPGGYTAAAVAGLIASLPVQTSPTNKTLAVSGVSTQLNTPRLEKLVQSRVLAVEKREGYRVVKGITTATNPAWHQVTTRRIVDYAIYGVRSACNPYIGKLNNSRVRSAMKATIDGFLTRMVQDEALVGYQLEVGATRAQEIAGEAIVTMTIQPTFSIDFIMVTMYLG
ncbi:MAG TPA: phage tail sheath C-terminal domain-containing protein [Longimicrobium sp.]|nr:phage tail sheath C-terminal domain-containing protein [Longimicrobium sp.]